jgi:hypothetical protein
MSVEKGWEILAWVEAGKVELASKLEKLMERAFSRDMGAYLQEFRNLRDQLTTFEGSLVGQLNDLQVKMASSLVGAEIALCRVYVMGDSEHCPKQMCCYLDGHGLSKEQFASVYNNKIASMFGETAGIDFYTNECTEVGYTGF